MATMSHNANGHRRRELVKRVLAEDTHCALCDKPLDKSLGMMPGQHGPKCSSPTCKGCVPHPLRVEVDEDLPRSRGGSPYYRANTSGMHRRCNAFKSNRTLAEARAMLHGNPDMLHAPVEASPIW